MLFVAFLLFVLMFKHQTANIPEDTHFKNAPYNSSLDSGDKTCRWAQNKHFAFFGRLRLSEERDYYYVVITVYGVDIKYTLLLLIDWALFH